MNYYVYAYTWFPLQMEERQWLRRGLNFDNVGLAFLALFSMLTIEGWQK